MKFKKHKIFQIKKISSRKKMRQKELIQMIINKKVILKLVT